MYNKNSLKILRILIVACWKLCYKSTTRPMTRFAVEAVGQLARSLVGFNVLNMNVNWFRQCLLQCIGRCLADEGHARRLLCGGMVIMQYARHVIWVHTCSSAGQYNFFAIVYPLRILFCIDGFYWCRLLPAYRCIQRPQPCNGLQRIAQIHINLYSAFADSAFISW